MRPRILQLSLLVLAGCARTGAADGPDTYPPGPVQPGAASEAQAGSPIDGIISDHVRQAILAEKTIGPDAGSIRVATQDGVVTLRGFVRAENVKQRVGVVARAVGSVARVENLLVVDPEAARNQLPMESVVERTISDRVRLAFSEDRTLAADARGVSVLTQNGVVRLSGTVASEAVKTRMGVVAHAVGSVVRVDNRLEVKQP